MAAKTREEAIDEALDRDAISQLPVLFCHAAWTDNPDLQAEQFAEHGSLMIESQRVLVTGRENLRAWFRKDLEAAAPLPLCHNHVIDLQGGGRARGFAAIEVRSKKYDTLLMGCGYFEDEYVKEGDAWKVLTRRVTFLYFDPHPTRPH